jgi:hypothetical protein
MKAETKNKYLHAMRAVMTFAFDECDLGKPPLGSARTHQIEGRARDRRLPFSPEYLQAIFNPVGYPDRSQPARFWIPLLALYTGARRGELIQLLLVSAEFLIPWREAYAHQP